MLTVYKKQGKREDNLYGIEEVRDYKELEKPILLCLSAQDFIDKSIYGIIREGMQAGRLYTTVENGALFKVDEFPVDFLGVRYKKDKSGKTKEEEIVDEIIYPIIRSDEKDVMGAISRARRINVMTYCNGTFTYVDVERILKERLRKDGYSDSEIKRIVSQIKVVAIETMVDTAQLDATTVTFIDVNDNEICDDRTDSFKRLLVKHDSTRVYGILNESSNSLYIYDGNGGHSLKDCFKEESKVKAAICSIVSMFLEYSLADKNVSSEDVMSQLDIYAKENVSQSQLLSQLDASLSYGGAPKYTVEEAMLQRRLDASYIKMALMEEKNRLLEEKDKKNDRKVSTLIEKLRMYSSDTTYYQVLISSGLYQSSRGRDVFSEASDKEIRAIYEEQKDNVRKI